MDDLKKTLELMKQSHDQQEEKYPTDIPNSVCNHAVLNGVLIDNNPGFNVGDIHHLFQLPYENVSLWTYAENKYSVLLTEVDERIKQLPIWKPFGYLFKIALTLHYFFESTIDYEYFWVYYFDPLKGIDENEFISSDQMLNKFTGQVIHLSELKKYLPIIHLLDTDEKFFVAASQFISSVESHWFCFFCEFQKGGYKKHPTHEPELEYRVNEIPKMEAAIVQCCKSVEAIIGKPKKRKNASDIYAAKKSWRSKINIDPDEIFFKADMTNFDYYYELFDLRNGSAHSFGTLSYEHTRDLTMKAQCFAYLVLEDYISSHIEDTHLVEEQYSINTKLFDHDKESFGTPLTGESFKEYFGEIKSI
ncbi:MAG: hypothetical protein JXQ67_06090 [Campylobacterales bacterium]|nr:hypothetical protein [Campylobacterales bacterium]